MILRNSRKANRAVVSDCRYGAAVDHVFGARHGRGAGRCEKGDQLRDFARFRGPSDRNATERIHQHPPGAVVVGALSRREVIDQPYRAIGFDPTGGDAHDANALRADLVRERLL